MATQVISAIDQSLTEVRIFDFNFVPDLEAGATIVSAIAVHIPPSGVASPVTVGTIVAGVVPVKLGPLTAFGQHYLDCIATVSDGEKLQIRLAFKCEY
jgi:hypothetical protein